MILEEDSNFDESVVANIILPNRPHSTSLRIEEVGSYNFDTQDQSVIYTISNDKDQRPNKSGIVDEIDSDSDHGMMFRKTTSRNVSIVSASEDEQSLGSEFGAGYSREISIDETHKDIQLEDGYAHVKAMKIVIEEQEVQLAELGEIEEKKLANGHNKQPELIDLKENIKNKRKTGKLMTMEEMDIVSDLSTSEYIQENGNCNDEIHVGCALTINKNKNGISESESATISLKKITNQNIQDDHVQCGVQLNVEEIHQSNGFSTEKHEIKITNGHIKSEQIDTIHTVDDDQDEEMKDLFKRIQKQRSVLNEILQEERKHSDELISVECKQENGQSKKDIELGNYGFFITFTRTKLINTAPYDILNWLDTINTT